MSVKISRYPGKEISAKEIESGRIFAVPFRTEFRYAWATGAAMSRFLQELKNGKIIARKCNNCRRVLVPPRMFCERCFRPTDRWVYVRDSGVVNTYSISYVATDASRLRKPQIIAVVEIDGASKGMGILHFLGDIQPKEARIGIRVRAVWKPANTRVGSIKDIRYFRPSRD